VRIDLFELLSKREIVHPTTLSSATFREGSIRLEISGYPWWIGGAWTDRGLLTLTFKGVSGGQTNITALLAGEDEDEFLELEIVPTASLHWASPERFSIYCSQPIPEPLKIHALVERYIAETGARRELGEILNGAHDLSRFLSFSSSPPFLLATGPEQLHDVLTAELERQAVAHTTHGGKGRAEARWFVALPDAWFFCEEAIAEWAD